MTTSISQNTDAVTSPYSVASDSNEPPSPSASWAGSGVGGLPLPLDCPSMGDPAAEVAALLALSFQEDRKHANESSDLEELNRLREGERRVAEMHEKADEIRREGWARGLSQVASAGCSVVGGSESLGASDPHKGDALLSLWSAGGKGFDATGTILGNQYQGAAQDDQAEADLAESRMDACRIARDKFGEEANDARQMFQKVMEFVKEMNEIRNATLQTVASFKA
jgi:hypothetical protein